MADAKAKTGKGEIEQDQSMEEILQSIKRIIAEEGDDVGAKESMSMDAGLGSSILELTDVVKDDGSVENIKSKAPAASQDVLANIDRAISPPTPVTAGEGLMSRENVVAAAAALKAINDVQRPAVSAPVRLDSPVFRSGVTVEDMVMESLKPMLKDWLDANLKGVVERLVEREIKRIVAQNT